LIGQDAMVQTLRNAFQQGRIAQSYMLTGVRGVGKTTTARLIARGLNYAKPGAEQGPSIDFSDEGEHCRAILEGRHLDVIEMDAASHTGIDDIREIIDSAHYKPNTARYKVYIIDEVHMLSKQAFNGLLKILEEPPAHVKFIFATTEIRKVPVTVLSRCQRFDLKRIEIEKLTAHLDQVTKAEGADADPAALLLIAKAAEGSVRDALSILDRAIAFAGGRLDAEQASALLGLADRGRIYDLLETVLKGDAGEALKQLETLNRDGAEPAQVIADLAEAVHFVTRVKAMGDDARDASLPQAVAARAAELAARLSMPVLARAWQMLLKGYDEVKDASRPLAAADMVLVRLAYAADLPSPADLLGAMKQGRLPKGGGKPAPAAEAPRPGREPAEAQAPESRAPKQSPVPMREAAPDQPPEGAGPQSFEEIVDLAEVRRDLKLKHALLDQLRLVSFRPGKLEINLLPDAPKELAQELARKLKAWTGVTWAVVVNSQAQGDITLGEKRRQDRADEMELIRNHPAVKEVFAQFPDARIEAVRPLVENGPAPDAPYGAEPGERPDDDDFLDERWTEDGTNR
jgi:DNA polymerase-3 subunit gamma/tau